MGRWLFLAIGLALVVEWPCRGERLEFARGGTVDGAVREEGDRAVYESPLGSLDFALDDIRAIQPGHWPPSEWASRWDTVKDADALGRFAAAWWALENGLIDECSSVLRDIHDTDPDHQPTARLVAVLDGLANSCPDPDLRDAAPLLRGIESVGRSEHLLLFHALSPDEAAARLALLERVLTAYYLSLSAYGVDLELPSQRAIVVWMPDRDTYRATLARAGAGALADTQGYFHPTLQVMLTYDGRSEPGYRAESRSIERRRDQHRRLLGLVRSRDPSARLPLGLPGEPAEGWTAPEALDALDAMRRDLDRRQLLLDRQRLDSEYGAAAHEMVHLLVRSSGLAVRHEDFPVWLHEGLAMQFEVVRSGRWAGVGRVNPHRLAFWAGPEPAPRLGGLLHDRGFGAGYRADAYAGAWALVYYLRKEHPDTFLALIDRLRHPGTAGGTPAERCAEALAAISGPRFERLEADWHRYIERLADEHAAASDPE